MRDVDLMAGFDVFICGAFEELKEACVAGTVTYVCIRNQIRFRRFSQMREGSPWKPSGGAVSRGPVATARIVSAFAFQFPL